MKPLPRFLLIFILLSIPLMLIGASIRTALTPLFVQVEYNLPGFPPDEYGFTTPDRLQWANYSIRYLLGRVSHEDLSAQRLPDESPLFTERELSHMLDVRILTRKVLNLWWLLIALVAAASYFLWKNGQKEDWFVTIRRGGNLTIALIFGILFVVTFNFKELFTQFHKIFFEGDSWLFLMSDNLIRLFPMRFWRDLFIFIGGLSIFLGDLLAFISKKYFKKHPKVIEQKTQE